MERFSIRFSLKLFFLATLCFCLATSSWAQPDGFSQSENDKSLISEQKVERRASILKMSVGFNETQNMEAQTNWAISGPPMD
jgi:hypothetical protein